jgi:hypothetical protein
MYVLGHNKSSSKVLQGFAALVAAFGLWVAGKPAAAMTFQTITGPAACAESACILAEGMIDQKSAGDLARYVRDNHIKAGALVVLNSEGGVLLYGLNLGETIRRSGFSTTVQGYDAATHQFRAGGECASACAFTFLGGVRRDVGEGSRIGVHQIYADPTARDGLSVGDAEWLAAQTAEHVDRMGGAVGILVEALRTAPDHIHWFSGRELTSLRVVTAGALVLASN